ncbi:MAG: LptF/LptG family permease [Thermodesulfobacteriota bacterium]|nr:LptF/LptG family permease [Thermodesulfobacteriota bacterium]
MLIQRYIFYAVIKAFFAIMGVLYGIMVIVEWVNMGGLLSPGDMDLLVLALVPMAVFIIPMALVFSVLMVFERLSGESEIVAMKASGIRMRAIGMPVIVFCFICLFFHLAIATFLGPMSMKAIQQGLVERAPEKIYRLIKPKTFIDTFKGLEVYMDFVDPVNKEISGIFIETKDHWIITAARGTMDVIDNAGGNGSRAMMRLENGSIFMDNKDVSRFMTFDTYLFGLDMDLNRDIGIRYRTMATQVELGRRIDKNRYPSWVKEYHDRLAFPVLNLILGATGLLFGIRQQRSTRYTGFVMGLGTILCYYLVFIFSDRLVDAGVLNPVVGSWLPDAVFGLAVIGIWLFRRKRGYI